MSKEKVVGTLCAAVRSVKHFSTEEKELLVLIGAELGVALEKAALYEESERVAHRFRELFENAHDAIWIHDIEGKILAANRGLSELTGYRHEDYFVRYL